MGGMSFFHNSTPVLADGFGFCNELNSDAVNHFSMPLMNTSRG